MRWALSDGNQTGSYIILDVYLYRYLSYIWCIQEKWGLLANGLLLKLHPNNEPRVQVTLRGPCCSLFWWRPRCLVLRMVGGFQEQFTTTFNGASDLGSPPNHYTWFTTWFYSPHWSTDLQKFLSSEISHFHQAWLLRDVLIVELGDQRYLQVDPALRPWEWS